MNEYQSLRKIGIQFFAEPEPNADTKPDTEPDVSTTNTDPEPDTEQKPKTFTQEEVNRLLANEKRQGRSAALKALGLDPADKDAEKKAKAILDAQKTDAEKQAEALEAEKGARTEAEKRAEAAERKFEVLEAGCKKEFVEEVLALATVKVTDEVGFAPALQAVKEKCPSFFADADDSGTGGGQGHRRQNQDKKPGSFGARLAQGVTTANTSKNPYFQD